MTKTISGLVWDNGRDATDRGWWYTLDGVADVVVSGTLDADSDREQVLAAVARQLRVDAVVEAL